VVSISTSQELLRAVGRKGEVRKRGREVGKVAPTVIVCPMLCNALDRIYKKAQLTQRERATAVHV